MGKQQGHRITWCWRFLVGCTLSGFGVVVLWAQTPAQPPGTALGTREPLRITMDELHRHGGVPPGWQFTLPEGNPKAGREAFVILQCHTCHTITGEQFPPVKPSERAMAPDLTGVGALHPAPYIAESILNPSAVVTDGPGYADANGYSNMPSYLEALSVRQLVDLVAYLQSLRDVTSHHHHTPAQAPATTPQPASPAHQHHAPPHQHHPTGGPPPPPVAR